MTSLNSTRAYKAHAMLRRIRRLESCPAFRPQKRVLWLHMDHRPQVPIKRDEHWVIDVLDDTEKPKGRWRRTTDPNDKGLRPWNHANTIYYHWGFNEDENVLYEDDESDAA